MIMMRGNFLLEFSDYFVEIRTQNGNPYLALFFRRLFGDCDLDREKEKRVNSQKSFVLMSWRSLFEVSDSLFIVVIIVSQIDRKICLVLTCWLTALDGAVFQVTRCMNVCRGKDFYHIQSIKKIDSNRLEIGAQTNIDIKLPYHWSRLLFFSFLLLPIITLSRTDQTQTRELNVKRCHNRTFDRKPVKLPSCEVVLQLETLSARSFAGRLFASLVVLLCTLLISLKK